MASETAAGWVYVMIVIALCGAAGWGAIRLLWSRSRGKVAIGVLLLLVSVVLPFFLGYGRLLGTIPAVLGAVVAAIQLFSKVGWRSRAGFAAILIFIAIEPSTWAFVGNLREAASLDRCQGEIAVKTIEADHRANGGYPSDMHTVAVDSDRYSTPPCPLYNNVNWVYQAGPTGYTIGYWKDWLVGKYVCLHTSGRSGWTCGLNRWGPFPPQDEKPLPPQRPA